MTWSGEPDFEKPEISVRATTLYYQIVAPIMLPFLERRVLNLVRCRGERCFFQRNRDHPPTGKEFDGLVQFERLQQKNGRQEDYLYLTSVDELIACARLQCVEFHGWGSRAGSVETPDRLVIDLDPDPLIPFERVKEASLEIRRGLWAVGLQSFALLSGGKGIHVIVPLEPAASWDEVRLFAATFCATLAEARPNSFTLSLAKRDRHDRIFLDFLRNQRTATAIQPYSVRARSGMPVAAPVHWAELEGIDSAAAFTIGDVDALLGRPATPELQGWGQGAQPLPTLR